MRTQQRRMLALLIAGLLLASSCATARSPQATYSIPPALAAVTLDASTTASGAVVYSLPEEQTALPRIAFTTRAWAAIGAWTGHLLADRCAMRVELQIANGGKADPDPVCLPAAKAGAGLK